MKGISYITNTKGEQEGLMINFKELKQLGMKTADIIASLQEEQKEIDGLIEQSSAAKSFGDLLKGKLKGM